MPKKTTGQIGPLKISLGEVGATVEQIDAGLSSNKEELEFFFAERFAGAFNKQHTLPGVQIKNLVQQDTSDLDFRIECSRASYLELAELTPLSEAFGQSAKLSGKFMTLEYATWIYENAIKAKFEKYGETAGRTFLLLYPTHSQFMPSEGLLQCLRSLCFWRGNRFAAVFVFATSGGPPEEALELITTISPVSGPYPAFPEAYKNHQFSNLTHMARPIDGGVIFGLPANPEG